MSFYSKNRYKTVQLIRFFVLEFLLVFFLNPVLSQSRQQEIKVLPVPAIGYSPETETYIGAVTLFTFKNKMDSLTRTSNTKIEFNYTWKNQLIIESDWNWFSPGEKWFSSGLIHYSKYPDLYYGIGYNTPSSNEMNFESDRFIIDFKLFKNINKDLFAGAGINYTSYSNISFTKVNDSFTDSDKSNLGVKAICLFDSRNNILSPSDGKYLEWENVFNMSKEFYFKSTVDYRKYFNFGRIKSHILSGRIYNETVLGNPPFYDFPMLGGDEYLRGYYLGRFRDENLSLIQFEYRTILFWRIGIATFGGVAAMYDSFKNIESNSYKPNVGVGLRFLVDKEEQTNLRIDYAVGAENQSGFYISFGESF